MASLDENILGWNQNTVGGEKYFKKTPCGVLVFFWPSGLSCYFETIVVYAQGAFM
jgi:hypothetical protein